MPLQKEETVQIGDIKASAWRTTLFSIPNLSASIAVTFYDTREHIGAIANILLPDSALKAYDASGERDGQYADLAIPMLLSAFTTEGGQKDNLLIRLTGGAQLFNFGGGGGNSLNMGARNATAIRSALAKLGLAVDNSDIGGNKTRKILFSIATGDITICQAGKETYIF